MNKLGLIVRAGYRVSVEIGPLGFWARAREANLHRVGTTYEAHSTTINGAIFGLWESMCKRNALD